jgi:hypothetical protein
VIFRKLLDCGGNSDKWRLNATKYGIRMARKYEVLFIWIVQTGDTHAIQLMAIYGNYWHLFMGKARENKFFVSGFTVMVDW